MDWKKIQITSAAALLPILLAGCRGSSRDSPRQPAEAAGSPTVTMELIQFKPMNLEVAAGASVTWIQKDAGVHTVTSERVEESPGGVMPKPDGKFDSEQIRTGKQFTFSFAEPGTYPFFCSMHPATMRGEVSLTPASSNVNHNHS